MPRDRGDAALLHDMLKASEAVVRYLGSKTREEFDRDEILRSAIERKIEIVGEACRKVTTEFRDTHSDIPWKKIVATRHVLAHDYDDINDDIIWRIATVYVPELVIKLRPLIPLPPPDPEGA